MFSVDDGDGVDDEIYNPWKESSDSKVCYILCYKKCNLIGQLCKYFVSIDARFSRESWRKLMDSPLLSELYTHFCKNEKWSLDRILTGVSLAFKLC